MEVKESLLSALRQNGPMRLLSRIGNWRRKRRLRKQGITVAFTDPKNPKRDWKPPRG